MVLVSQVAIKEQCTKRTREVARNQSASVIGFRGRKTCDDLLRLTGISEPGMVYRKRRGYLYSHTHPQFAAVIYEKKLKHCG